jgi:hypothetical protein
MSTINISIDEIKMGYFFNNMILKKLISYVAMDWIKIYIYNCF